MTRRQALAAVASGALLCAGVIAAVVALATRDELAGLGAAVALGVAARLLVDAVQG